MSLLAPLNDLIMSGITPFSPAALPFAAPVRALSNLEFGITNISAEQARLLLCIIVSIHQV